MVMQSANLLRCLNPHCAHALKAAAALCQSRAHKEITVEHWLLILLEQDKGDIAVIAQRYNWDRRSMRQALLGYLNTLPRKAQEKPPLSGRLQQLIQQARLQASGQADLTTIRSLHLLLTLTAHKALLTYVALAPLLSLNRLPLESLFPLLNARSEESPLAPAAQPGARSIQAELTSFPSAIRNEASLAVLKKYTLDLTARAKANLIASVQGRDQEIDRLADSLTRPGCGNPIIVGEHGVGKSTLVEGLAQRIASGNVSDTLKKVSLRKLNIALLEDKGDERPFMQRLNGVIEAAAHSPETVWLFIDDIHMLPGAADGASVVRMLKKASGNGKLRLIAAITASAYRQWFGQGAVPDSYFQKIEVGEPDDQTACEMLYTVRARFSTDYGIQVQDAALNAAVSLSRRYLPARQLPGKALDLLDKARERMHMSLSSDPEPLVKIKAELAALAYEQQAIEQSAELSINADPARLADISDRSDLLCRQQALLQRQYQQERELIRQLFAVRQDPRRGKDYADIQRRLREVQGCAPLLSLELDLRAVAMVIADWTGIPLERVLHEAQTSPGSVSGNGFRPSFFPLIDRHYLTRRIKKQQGCAAASVPDAAG